MRVGERISFGDFDWRVLAVQKDTALIITESIIEQRSYHNSYQEITWADCALRKYLTDEFYHRFTAEDQARIVPVINRNSDNQSYGSKGGTDTRDRIFLLSIEEAVCRYFGDSRSKLYTPGKNQRYWFERKDENNSTRVAMFKDSIWWWWLRSPGRVNVKAAYIHGDGNIGIQGNNILKGNISDGRCTGGVRPALWLTL